MSYDPATGDLTATPDISEQAINDLVTNATATGVNTQDFWLAVADYLRVAKGGFGNFTAQEDGWLDTAIQTSDPALSWQDIKDLAEPVSNVVRFFGTGSDDNIIGTAGDNEITLYEGDDIANGLGGNDVISGLDGNDTLNGGDGDDTLNGGDDDDTLNPGDGGDTALGGNGNDTYIYTSGDDFYGELLDPFSLYSDKIVLPTGIVLSDLSFTRLGANDLRIDVGTLGTIEIEGQINTTKQIEVLEFADSSTVNLITLPGIVTNGTSGDDNIDGIVAPGISNVYDDVINGLGGDDSISASGGERHR